MQCKPTGEAIDDGRRHATTITRRALGVGAIKPTRKSYEWDDGDDDGLLWGYVSPAEVESTAASTSSDRNNLAARPSFSRGKQKKGVPLRRRMEMAPLAWRWWLLHKTGKGGATPLLLCETHTIGRKSLEIDPFFSGSVGADVQT